MVSVIRPSRARCVVKITICVYPKAKDHGGVHRSKSGLFKLEKEELNLKESKFIGRLTMSSSKLPVWLIATTMLLSMGFVLYPQGSANAAKYCAQLRGATAEGHPDCSFSTLDKCRARVRHRGGGHCYRSH